MGQFEYDQARQVFDRLARQYPQIVDLQINLAIATLNRQYENDEQQALALLRTVLQDHPQQLRALYCAGLLEMHAGRPSAAATHFEKVIDGDPADAAAAYFLAQAYMQLERHQEALSLFEDAYTTDPYLRSAYYGAFRALQRMDRRAEALEALNTFKRLKNNPRARLVEFKYMNMGAKAEVRTLDASARRKTPKPNGPLFASAKPLTGAAGLQWPRANRPNLTVCDINSDGQLDLFVAGASAKGMSQPNAVLIRKGAADYQPAPTHPLAAIGAVNAVLWGDFDNDGLTDAYLLRQGANQLWRQSPARVWQNISTTSQTQNETYNSVDGAFFDADHDGDLDLFVVNADGPNELLNNNRDGTFRPLAADYGLAGSQRTSRAVLTVDLDQDHDLDLIIINQRPPHEVYLNHLAWNYRPAPGWERFCQTNIAAAVAADIDADGRNEIYTIEAPSRFQRWQADAQQRWRASELEVPAPIVSTPVDGLTLSDLDGDGVFDILASGSAGWWAASLVDNAMHLLFRGALLPPSNSMAWALVASMQGPELVCWSNGQGMHLWPAGPGRYQFAGLQVSGRQDQAEAMRSNASGIGTRFSVRIDSDWQVSDTLRKTSEPGQSLQPLWVGLAGAESIDFVAIDWSDGVYQTEMNLGGGALHRIAETQRQLSSCPVLFAWDGHKFAFVTDVLGVGGMGYFLAPGQYAPSRPHEKLMLPSDLLQPHQKRLLLRLAEPMEEVTYLDAVRLVAYDLPPGWALVVDERMGITPPEPSSDVFFYRQRVLPQRAYNDRAEDVSSTIAQRDLRAAPVGGIDERFIGLLNHEHVLTLEFAQPLQRPDGNPLLLADGWVEYPYSQTNFAAWQAGSAYRAPTLEASDTKGRFKVIHQQFGYPAGMPRAMALPLSGLPKGTRVLRLRTNQEIYWDRLAVVFTEPCPQARLQVLPLLAARLERIGFPLRTDGPQRLPNYDYDRRIPQSDMHLQDGFYTRFGPIEALVRTRDDGLAVFGPGEAVHLAFAIPPRPIPPGWTRTYVLEVDGWCKDMDRYTRNGTTVAPLPSRQPADGHAAFLHRRFNTRYRSGRL
jgi:tetratricopeptide (TPR) repeat protein